MLKVYWINLKKIWKLIKKIIKESWKFWNNLKENVDLIKEINDLKREKKFLKEELSLRIKPNGSNNEKGNIICIFI
jgi:hypothetical protein